jgi:hypothetical protein
MTEGWLQQAVEEFWARAGQLEPFPRNLEEPILWALPLAVEKIPRLRVTDVKNWLKQNNIPRLLDSADRRLHGCLVAYKGRGSVFLDETDSEEQRRFSLAHETAHFLIDHWQPRQYAIAELGSEIIEVLDGIRPMTRGERVSAILSNVTIGVHVNLMERQPDRVLGHSHIIEIEDRADRLALELLAPMDEVRQRIVRQGYSSIFQEGVDLTVTILVEEFGLPREIAETYGNWLCWEWYGGPSFREQLGL